MANTAALSLRWKQVLIDQSLPSNVEVLDAQGGWPRGRITEIVGETSSGRTTLLHRLLAETTSRGEISAVVDANDSFDPSTASLNGIQLDRLVWIRCGGKLEHFMRVADLLLHSGGLGVVVLDLCDTPSAAMSRLPTSYWFRFRRAVETSQTICVTIADRPVAKSCSTLIVETNCRAHTFTKRIFRDSVYTVGKRKPYTAQISELKARCVR